jgi:hypothetical protein
VIEIPTTNRLQLLLHYLILKSFPAYSYHQKRFRGFLRHSTFLDTVTRCSRVVRDTGDDVSLGRMKNKRQALSPPIAHQRPQLQLLVPLPTTGTTSNPSRIIYNHNGGPIQTHRYKYLHQQHWQETELKTEHSGLKQDGTPDKRVGTGEFAQGKIDPHEARKQGVNTSGSISASDGSSSGNTGGSGK